MKKTHLTVLVATCLFSLKGVAAEGAALRFDKKPFISPAIIKDLSTWISDSGDQVVAINLDDSHDSNRYFGEIVADPIPNGNSKTSPPYPFVHVNETCDEQGGTGVFGYRLVGEINGVFVLHTTDGGCGSGVFHNLLLVKLEQDIGFGYSKGVLHPKVRHVVRKLIEIPIGDRYHGSIGIENNAIVIKKDENERDPAITNDMVIKLNGYGS